MIFGINGQKRVGKDETGNSILRQVTEDVSAVKVAYADKMKDSFCALFNITRDQLEELKAADHEFPGTVNVEITQYFAGGTGKVHSGLTFREAIQRFGTEGHRYVFGQDFWVDALFPVGYRETHDVMAVCDVRFPDEAKRIIELGGKIIRVLNGPLLPPEHESEQILDPSLIHYEIDNSVRDDNFEALDKQVLQILKIEEIPFRTGVVHAAGNVE